MSLWQVVQRSFDTARSTHGEQPLVAVVTPVLLLIRISREDDGELEQNEVVLEDDCR